MRYNTLKMMVAKAHCTNVETVNADFLTVDPDDKKYSQVTHMSVHNNDEVKLLTPSVL